MSNETYDQSQFINIDLLNGMLSRRTQNTDRNSANNNNDQKSFLTAVRSQPTLNNPTWTAVELQHLLHELSPEAVAMLQRYELMIPSHPTLWQPPSTRSDERTMAPAPSLGKVSTTISRCPFATLLEDGHIGMFAVSSRRSSTQSNLSKQESSRHESSKTPSLKACEHSRSHSANSSSSSTIPSIPTPDLSLRCNQNSEVMLTVSEIAMRRQRTRTGAQLIASYNSLQDKNCSRLMHNEVFRRHWKQMSPLLDPKHKVVEAVEEQMKRPLYSLPYVASNPSKALIAHLSDSVGIVEKVARSYEALYTVRPATTKPNCSLSLPRARVLNCSYSPLVTMKSARQVSASDGTEKDKKVRNGHSSKSKSITPHKPLHVKSARQLPWSPQPRRAPPTVPSSWCSKTPPSSLARKYTNSNDDSLLDSSSSSSSISSTSSNLSTSQSSNSDVTAPSTVVTTQQPIVTEEIQITLLTQTYIQVLSKCEDYQRRQLKEEEKKHRVTIGTNFKIKLHYLTQQLVKQIEIKNVEETQRNEIQLLQQEQWLKLITLASTSHRYARMQEEVLPVCPVLRTGEKKIIDVSDKGNFILDLRWSSTANEHVTFMVLMYTADGRLVTFAKGDEMIRCPKTGLPIVRPWGEYRFQGSNNAPGKRAVLELMLHNISPAIGVRNIFVVLFPSLNQRYLRRAYLTVRTPTNDAILPRIMADTVMDEYVAIAVREIVCGGLVVCSLRATTDEDIVHVLSPAPASADDTQLNSKKEKKGHRTHENYSAISNTHGSTRCETLSNSMSSIRNSSSSSSGDSFYIESESRSLVGSCRMATSNINASTHLNPVRWTIINDMKPLDGIVSQRGIPKRIETLYNLGEV